MTDLNTQHEKGVEFITKTEMISAWNSLAKDNIRKLFSFLEGNPHVLFIIIKTVFSLFHQEVLKNIQSIYNNLSIIFKYKLEDIHLNGNNSIKTNNTLEKVIRPVLKEYYKDIFLNRKQSELNYCTLLTNIKSFYQKDTLKTNITKDIQCHLNKVFTHSNHNVLNMFDNLTKIFLFLEFHEPKLCISFPDKLQFQNINKHNDSSNTKIFIPVFPIHKSATEFAILIPPPQFKSNQFIYDSFIPIVYIKPKHQMQSTYKNQYMKHKIRLVIFQRINQFKQIKSTNGEFFSSRNTKINKKQNNHNIESSNQKNSSMKSKQINKDNTVTNLKFGQEFKDKIKNGNRQRRKVIRKQNSYSRPKSNSKNKKVLTISTEIENKHKNGRNSISTKNYTEENDMSSTLPNNFVSKVPSAKRFINISKTEKSKHGLSNGMSLYHNYYYKNSVNLKNCNITRIKLSSRLNKKTNNENKVKISLSNPNLQKTFDKHTCYSMNHKIFHSKQENSNAFTSRSNAG